MFTQAFNVDDGTTQRTFLFDCLREKMELRGWARNSISIELFLCAWGRSFPETTRANNAS